MKAVLFALLMTCCLFSSASAIIEPDPNNMSIYFDLNADVTRIEAVPFAFISAYVILTRPTFDTIDGYEFGYEIDGGQVWTLGVDLVGEDRTDLVFKEGLHIVQLPEPLAVGEATVLCTISVLLLDVETVFFKLTGARQKNAGVRGLPAVTIDGNPRSIDLAWWEPALRVPMYCAAINFQHSEVTEQSTWGQMKTLFQ